MVTQVIPLVLDGDSPQAYRLCCGADPHIYIRHNGEIVHGCIH